MGFTQGEVPVFSEAAMSGDTEHLGVYVLNGKLLCGDRVHFILQRETNVLQIACCCLEAIVETFPSPAGMTQWKFAGGRRSCEKAAALIRDYCCPPQRFGTKSCER